MNLGGVQVKGLAPGPFNPHLIPLPSTKKCVSSMKVSSIVTHCLPGLLQCKIDGKSVTPTVGPVKRGLAHCAELNKVI
jgi:hypothetical protein